MELRYDSKYYERLGYRRTFVLYEYVYSYYCLKLYSDPYTESTLHSMPTYFDRASVH